MKRIVLHIGLLAITAGLYGLETPQSSKVSYGTKLIEDTVAKLKKDESKAARLLHQNFGEIKRKVSELKKQLDELIAKRNQLSDKETSALENKIRKNVEKIETEAQKLPS